MLSLYGLLEVGKALSWLCYRHTRGAHERFADGERGVELIGLGEVFTLVGCSRLLDMQAPSVLCIYSSGAL